MRPILFAACVSASIISFLSACSTISVGLHYAPSTALPQASTALPAVAVGAFVDQRGESATWLGAIRGGYGNPIKKLESERPVTELVRTAFAEGLRARGIPIDDAAAQTHIVGVIKKLDCSQYARREAHVDIEISVLDQAGRPRFTRRYTADNVDGSLLSLQVGIFASVEDLRALMENTLREAVDQSLDDTPLRAALQGQVVNTVVQNSEPVPSDTANAQMHNLSIDEYRQMKKVLQGE